MPNAYHYIGEFWKKRKSPEFRKLRRDRLIAWRREQVVTRIKRPTRLDRARQLGYRAKQGYIMVRTRIRRGSRRRPMPVQGRRPKRMGSKLIQARKNLRLMAEERVQRNFTNLQILNSYWVAQDSRHKYFEVILVDPSHPVIYNDPRISWIGEVQHKRRVNRGLTSAGKKGRGLRRRGRGAEKIRPSLRSNKRKGN
ncbi:MAG: 50S ribosomal protein L15e [Candidatus Kariarchaeaceae archaeon]